MSYRAGKSSDNKNNGLERTKTIHRPILPSEIAWGMRGFLAAVDPSDADRAELRKPAIIQPLKGK